MQVLIRKQNVILLNRVRIINLKKLLRLIEAYLKHAQIAHYRAKERHEEYYRYEYELKQIL